MYVTFEEIYLRELYETGKTSDKKHRYQPDIVRRYQRCVDYLLDAPGIERIKSIIPAATYQTEEPETV